ncbi:MAG: acyl carrier protein [Sulfuricaulis sp.]
MTATLQKVQKIFANKFSLAQERVRPEASLESLGLDSLDAIEVMFDIEDEFQIRIPQDRRENELKINTVQDIIDVIDRLVAEQRPGNLAESTK